MGNGHQLLLQWRRDGEEEMRASTVYRLLCPHLRAANVRVSRATERVPRNKEFSGQMTVIVKPGEGHFFRWSQDPTAVVDFVVGKSQ